MPGCGKSVRNRTISGTQRLAKLWQIIRSPLLHAPGLRPLQGDDGPIHATLAAWSERRSGAQVMRVRAALITRLAASGLAGQLRDE